MFEEVDEAIRDLTHAKQRLKAFFLRHGYRCSVKANWCETHQRYLRELVLSIPSLTAVLEENLLAIDQTIGRLHGWLLLALAAGLGLLALFGAGGAHTDVGAHLAGFAAGLLLGFTAGLRRADARAGT